MQNQPAGRQDIRRTPNHKHIEFLGDPAKDVKPKRIREKLWGILSPASRLSVADTDLIRRNRRKMRQFKRLMTLTVIQNEMGVPTMMDLNQADILAELYLRTSKDGYLLEKLTREERHMTIEDLAEKAPKGGVWNKAKSLVGRGD